MSIIAKVKRSLLSIPGWSTRRKIVVIESDDWGSIRMPSRKVFDKLSNAGLDVTTGDSWRYNHYDTLANREDLDALYETLRKYKDRNGNHPVFTAVGLVANPDFEKIQQHGFQSYFYEPLTATLKRYYPNDDVFSYWKQGIAERLFIPQFHGREHLNVGVWMKQLQAGDQETHIAFQEGLWGFNNRHPRGISYQAAFHPETTNDLAAHAEIIADGLVQFEKLFGYKATFFVPPNGVLHEDLYGPAKHAGVNYLFSAKMHQVPVTEGGFKTRLNFLGKKNSAGQRFIIRNAFFEPSQGGKDWTAACLGEIREAFRWRKPAIISSHRVNFIGAIDVRNRENGLKNLNELLANIVKNWPDVEFLSSDQLGDIMNHHSNHGN